MVTSPRLVHADAGLFAAAPDLASTRALLVLLLRAWLLAASAHLRKQHGKGKFVYRSGNVYDGDWSNDVPHGKGIFLEGNVIYDIEHNQGTVSPWPDTMRTRICASAHARARNASMAIGCPIALRS